MHEGEEQPRTRSGAPRRPVRHRARPGGSARPVGDQDAAEEPTLSDAPPAPSRGGSRAAGRSGAGQASRPSGVHHRSRPAGSRAAGPSAASGSQDDRRASVRGLDAEERREDRTPRGARTPGRRGARTPGRRSARTPGRRSASRIPRPLRLGAFALVLLLVVVTAWGTGLVVWANSRIEHVDALSGRADTPGQTYLVAGSDRRGGDTVASDGTEGARADTLMLLHRAPNGNSYLVSLPRDTLVDIPGHGRMKLNAAYALGGPKLLVQTVEDFTGLTVDHFVEIGFDGVSGLVDAVGTVNLCIDQDVDDVRSGLKMTKGCHDVGGEQALAFVRARYFDPTADLGRQQRQQQFVAALMKRVATPGVLLNPLAQVRLADAGTRALRTDEGTGVIDLGRMALAMRHVMKDGTTLTMPFTDENYRTKHSGVAILTDDAQIASFFGAIRDGSAKAPAKEG